MNAGDDDDEDVAAFRAAVRDARPIPDDGRVHLPGRRPGARARFSRAAEREVMRAALHEGDDGTDLSSGEELRFRRDHLGLKAFRRLRRGGFPIYAELDLHGLTLAQARDEVQQLLGRTTTLDSICVRIITGRGLRSAEGRPVIKPAVAGWLRKDPRVLGYASARQVDGGLGAIYVLIASGKR